jgi:hypothetical protein
MLGDGWIEMQTRQHRGLDGGEYNELDHQGCEERQLLNIDVNQSYKKSDEHRGPDIVMVCVVKLYAGEENQREIDQKLDGVHFGKRPIM